MGLKLGIKFGLGVIQSGQKNGNVEIKPQLEVKSTAGQFSITGPVSRALNIAVGENIVFLNDRDQIQQAIIDNRPEVVNFAAENGFDLTKSEDIEKFLDEVTTWFIAKGYAKFDSVGLPLKANVRMSRKDKVALFEREYNAADDENKEYMLNAMREVMENPEATLEDILTAILEDDKVSASVTKTADAYEGSKTAASSNAVGVGIGLTFTDTNIWHKMKSNMPLELREKKKRIYNVLLEQPSKIEVYNGYENAEITAYPLEFVDDVDPVILGSKKED